MGKVKTVKGRLDSQAAKAMESQTASIVDFKFDDLLFTSAAHPSKNLIALGSATGHVKMIQYDGDKLEDKKSTFYNNNITNEKSLKYRAPLVKIGEKSVDVMMDDAEKDNVVVAWKTKRHKGSCRAVTFDHQGEHLYSVGLDDIVKKASSETGQVVSKSEQIILPTNSHISKLVTVPNKDFLLVGTETGVVIVYDTRDLKKEVYRVTGLHDNDAINSISHMVPKSDYQFISTGSTTLTHFDIRKGVIQTSEDQEDELLAGTWCDPGNVEANPLFVAGMGEGIVTIWDYKKNQLYDQISRVRVCHSKDSVESLISCLDETSIENCVWCGSTDGLIKKVNVKQGRVVESRLHSTKDEVSSLDIDYDYRLISAGMDKLKIWGKSGDDDDDDDDDSDDDDESMPSDDESSDEENIPSDDDEESSHSDEEVSGEEAEKKVSVPDEEGEWGGFDEATSDNDAEELEESDSDVEDEGASIKERIRNATKKRLSGNLSDKLPEKKKIKTNEASSSDESHSGSSSDGQGNDVSDSDDSDSDSDSESNQPNGKLVQLKDIRDRLLKQLEDSDDDDDDNDNDDDKAESPKENAEVKSDNAKTPNEESAKKLTKKEKRKLKQQGKPLSTKQLKNQQTHVHGITKFDDL